MAALIVGVASIVLGLAAVKWARAYGVVTRHQRHLGMKGPKIVDYGPLIQRVTEAGAKIFGIAMIVAGVTLLVIRVMPVGAPH